MTMGLFVHVVDDDESFRKSVARLLRACGFDVKEYGSAQEFLGVKPEPGCILLDVRMPRMGGFELQERLAETASTLPIVFLSGHADIPDSVKAMKAGAEDFLSKPARKAAIDRCDHARIRRGTVKAAKGNQRATRCMRSLKRSRHANGRSSRWSLKASSTSRLRTSSVQRSERSRRTARR